MGVEVIRDRENTLCIILRSGYSPSATRFFTPVDAALQVGQIVHPCGHEIARHEHSFKRRTVEGTVEVLLLQCGRCEMDIYDLERKLLSTHELAAGDLVVLLNCGHSFRMLEDSVLLEVKQGPYLGPNEKELF